MCESECTGGLAVLLHLPLDEVVDDELPEVPDDKPPAGAGLVVVGSLTVSNPTVLSEKTPSSLSVSPFVFGLPLATVWAVPSPSNVTELFNPVTSTWVWSLPMSSRNKLSPAPCIMMLALTPFACQSMV